MNLTEKQFQENVVKEFPCFEWYFSKINGGSFKKWIRYDADASFKNINIKIDFFNNEILKNYYSSRMYLNNSMKGDIYDDDDDDGFIFDLNSEEFNDLVSKIKDTIKKLKESLTVFPE